MKLAKRDCKKYILLLLLLATVVLVVNSSVVLAKYTSERKHESEISDIVEFHFTSDIAEVGGVTYPWYNGIFENGVFIEVYNYDKDNVALISDVDLTYTVTAADCKIECYDSNGQSVTANAGGSYTIPAIADGEVFAKNFHILHITPNSVLPADDVEVVIESQTPFRKTLSATFDVGAAKRDIDYTVANKTDRGEYVLVTIHTNAYKGNLNISWPAGVAPDVTDPLMSGWINASEGVIVAERVSTYELIFFELQDAEYTTDDIKVTKVAD